MNITVTFFGPAREFAENGRAVVALPDGATTLELRAALGAQVPRLTQLLRVSRLALNNEFIADDRRLVDGDVVSVIPPVSGGAPPATWVELSAHPITAAAAIEFVSGDPGLGGIVLFEGVTRRELDASHGALSHLAYEAHAEMARSQMQRLADEAMDRWRLGRVAIVHRIGEVPPAAPSVIIAVAAGHRAEAFEACRWLIDTLKADVAIWKKDIFEDGFARWVGPNAGGSAS